MVLAAPLLGWLGRAGTLGLGGGREPRFRLPRGRPCAPPGVRFADLSGVVVAGAAGCAVSVQFYAGIHHALISGQYANCCRGTLLYTFGVPDFAPHFPFLWI